MFRRTWCTEHLSVLMHYLNAILDVHPVLPVQKTGEHERAEPACSLILVRAIGTISSLNWFAFCRGVLGWVQGIARSAQRGERKGWSAWPPRRDISLRRLGRLASRQAGWLGLGWAAPVLPVCLHICTYSQNSQLRTEYSMVHFSYTLWALRCTLEWSNYQAMSPDLPDYWSR